MGQNPFISQQYLGGILMECHLILKISSPILVQFWEKMEAKNSTLLHFGLQGAGIKSPGVNPQTALHLFNVGVSSTLTCGCASIYIKLTSIYIIVKHSGGIEF